jgi:hypothetical protein
MSLILLFLPHDSTPVHTQSAFTPGVVQEVSIARPTLMSVQEATGVFETSTTTYSSTTDTYNSGLYGGAVPEQPKGSLLYNIDTLSPTLFSVEEATGVFNDTSDTYNSTTETYNSGTYGGASFVLTKSATLLSIDQATPKVYSIEKI